MAFPIVYVNTEGTRFESDLLPGGSTLAMRVRILESKKEQILLIDKLAAALLLIANFIWDQEIAIDDFFAFENAATPSSLETMRASLFVVLQKVITSKSDRNKFAGIVEASAASKMINNSFAISFQTEGTHNYESITDEQIASLLQEIVINNMSTTLRLL